MDSQRRCSLSSARTTHDKNRVRMFFKKLRELFFQSLFQDAALGAEVNAGRDLVRDAEKSILDAAPGILQTEIECGALPCLETPDRLTLGDGGRQPEREPRLSHLRCARQNVQAL